VNVVAGAAEALLPDERALGVDAQHPAGAFLDGELLEVGIALQVLVGQRLVQTFE